ncbi:N-acetyltransferase [Cohnella endophytica]|uniref:N-acetyltransferase n=1 Tax=Cohnella endophytica TaxID=2419778 RepID=A0A494X746_9BACL|nr:GNAT family N-acetyltransferase [Cohnella endophytica]RKP44106.1 N-acetyltransferase [Cohnella endophytica]
MVVETERLILRRQTTEDAAFILELMNDPSWIQNIGDRGLRTVEDASNYIVRVALGSYERFGYGFYVAELKDGGVPIGICGLAKRDFLEDADIGYALLPAYWGKGYAYEAASAVMEYARSVLGLGRIVAFTSPGNEASAKLLTKLGMHDEGLIPYNNTDEMVRLFVDGE